MRRGNPVWLPNIQSLLIGSTLNAGNKAWEKSLEDFGHERGGGVTDVLHAVYHHFINTKTSLLSFYCYEMLNSKNHQHRGV